eukprot:g6881.t1
MGPAAHRLPADLQTERSLEEVILARKMTASAELQIATSRYERFTSAGGEPGPERGILASPSSSASFLSRLPPEAYAREASSRLGKRRRSKAMRRSTPDQRIRGGGGGSFPMFQQHLRPLTGVSPPRTAQQSPFTLADYAVEGAQPMTGSWGHERGMGATRCVYNESNGAHNGADGFDTEKRVSFLTDKCNALARRLQQVETQLENERADGKKRLHEAQTALSSQFVESSNNNNNLSYSYFDNRSGRGGGQTGNTGAGVERTAVDYSTPRTAGSNPSRAHLSPGKGHTQGQQQKRPQSSGAALSGVMMPPDVVQAIRDRKKPRGSGGGSKMDAEALHCEVVEKEIADRFDVVTDGIEKLENVFSGAAQILEHRVRAITTISRELAKRGLQRQKEARERVVKKAIARGEMGLYVTDAMVRQEMSRQAVELMQGKVEVNLSRSVLARLKQAVALRNKAETTARAHFRRWASKRVMKGWRRWAALKADGMDRKLMTSYKSGATRMQRKKLTEVVMGAFDTWKDETKKSKQVKKIAVGMWADFSLKDLGEPFRMWYIYADFSKKQTREHERLLKLYRRAKNRKKTHSILKAWRHLAVYGRIEGMYTRSQLMASLAEQKEHTLRLVGKVDELTGGLGDMEELAMEYRAQMIARQRETGEREDSMDRQTMALHHAEQEVVRLQCLLASAAEVAPHICKAIHKVAPGFNFRDRGLQPFTKARAEALEMEVEARVQDLVVKRMALQSKADPENSKHSSDGGNNGGGRSTAPNSARGGHPTSAGDGAEQGEEQAEAGNIAVVTADAQTQARLPVDPEAAARAAVAAAALAQGVEPPILPKELARLDRVEWVLRRTSLAEVAARLKREKEERDSEEGTEYGFRSGGARRPDFASAEAWGGINNTAVEGGGGETEEGPKNAAGAAVVPSASSPSTSASASEPTSAAAAATAAALAPPESGSTGDNRTQGTAPSMSTTTGGEEEEDDGEEYDVADRLAGIFEFLRSGNPLLLPPDLRDDWDSRPDLGLGLLSADDHTDDLVRRHHVRSLSSRPATAAGAIDSSPTPAAGEETRQARAGAENNSAVGGGGKAGKGGGLPSFNFTADGGSGKGVSTWASRGLYKEARSGGGEPMTYHDLRMALTATAPRGRRSETTNEKLERRLMDRRNRAEQMAAALWGNNRQGLAENLYARSFEQSSSSLKEDRES